jgi:hypothetical protein
LLLLSVLLLLLLLLLLLMLLLSFFQVHCWPLLRRLLLQSRLMPVVLSVLWSSGPI